MVTLGSRSLLPAALVLLALGGGKAAAQRESYSYLSYVGSDVALVSKGDDESLARVNTPILSGDQIATGTSSRAEVILADGNIVRVDSRTELRFDRMARTYESDDDRDLLYLTRGSVFVEVQEATTRESAFRLDTEDSTILAPNRVVFRADTSRRGTEIYVLSGRVEVNGRGGRALVRAGEYAWVSGSEEIELDQSEPPRDRFTRFVEERRERRPSPSGSRYVPAEYSADYDAAGLDDYGSWVFASTYNQYCWRPNVVADWRPYSAGYWRWSPCGLTWVASEPWGWLPFHYGQWALDAAYGWCWLPGSFYSPAWVYWSYAPGWVGWCPMGYYGYHGPYHGARRTWFGDTRGVYYPHLSGRVAVARIDHRGWSYVASGRLGVRFDAGRDIVRGDHVPFRAGDVSVISTSPLRIDRGGAPSTHTAIQDALRRLPVDATAGRSGGPVAVNEGLTSVLRREATLSAGARDELKRSYVRTGQDAAYRPVTEGPRAAASEPLRGGWRERTTGVPREVTRGAGSGRAGGSATEGSVRRSDGWRSPSSPSPRPIEPRLGDRPAGRDDTGWRAPRVIEREAPARGTTDAPRPEIRREAPVYQAPVREAPVRQAPAPAPPPPQAAPAPPPPQPRSPASEVPRRDSSLRSRFGPTRVAAFRGQAPSSPAPRLSSPASRPATGGSHRTAASRSVSAPAAPRASRGR